MNLIAVKDLKSPRALREKLKQERELLLTSNGKPMAIMFDLSEGEDPEMALRAVREARSRLALQRVREAACRSGRDRLSKRDINELIAKARAERTDPT
jgi:hypothetical protein